MKRKLYMLGGYLAVGLGLIGLVLPIMPTVPFMILAAFLFSRGDPRWEAWLLNHRQFGPHIRAWRDRGAISRKGKLAATLAFMGSAALGLWLLSPPYAYAPAAIGIMCGTWIWSRPS